MGSKAIQALRNILKNQNGATATAIEYGLIAGLISVVIIVAVGYVGTDLKGAFKAISCALNLGGAGCTTV